MKYMVYLSHRALIAATQTAPTQTNPPFSGSEPALALLEFESVAQGILAGDAMVKKAEIKLIHAGTVQPGRYLVLLGGTVAEVEESLKAGREIGTDNLADTVWLPGVHPRVLQVIHSAHRPPPQQVYPAENEALGIIETRTAPSAIEAADIAVKGAQINLISIRLADGLGGKGLVLLSGKVSDVEAARDLVTNRINGLLLLQAVVISQLHTDMIAQIFGATRFFRS